LGLVRGLFLGLGRGRVRGFVLGRPAGLRGQGDRSGEMVVRLVVVDVVVEVVQIDHLMQPVQGLVIAVVVEFVVVVAVVIFVDLEVVVLVVLVVLVLVVLVLVVLVLVLVLVVLVLVFVLVFVLVVFFVVLVFVVPVVLIVLIGLAVVLIGLILEVVVVELGVTAGVPLPVHIGLILVQLVLVAVEHDPVELEQALGRVGLCVLVDLGSPGDPLWGLVAAADGEKAARVPVPQPRPPRLVGRELPDLQHRHRRISLPEVRSRAGGHDEQLDRLLRAHLLPIRRAVHVD